MSQTNKSPFKIEKGIPLPKMVGRKHKQNKYPFKWMLIGDSFTTGKKFKTAGESDVAIRSLGSAARNWKAKVGLRGWKFTTAKMPDRTIRIWRVK